MLTAILLPLLIACADATTTDNASAASAPLAKSTTEADARIARIVAVGDLHADLTQALATLRLAGLVDADGAWAGGTTTFVQTGDLTDRGPDSRDIIALMQRLEQQAAAAGGRVIALLGNHEAMNLLGDWRYVHPGDIERYGGLEARKAAYQSGGDDHRWLVARDAVAIVDGTVFTHGGVAPAAAKLGIDAVNRAIRESLKTPSGAATPMLGEAGPLWYRGFVLDDEPAACAALSESLALLNAKRMVVGHTTRRDGRIQARCDGALLVIDVGIAAHYGGNIAALELRNGDAWALYPTGAVDLPDPSLRTPDPSLRTPDPSLRTPDPSPSGPRR